MRTAAIAILCLSLCGTALAEPLHDVRLALSASSPMADLGPSVVAASAAQSAVTKPTMQQLSDLRLSIRSVRRTAGFTLLGFGLLSVAVGGAIAVVGHEQHALLAAGITSATFGAVNAALSFGLLDLSGTQEQHILADRARDPSEFTALRESELIAHLHSGQFFAVNAGLDVFYIATGALLCVIAAVRNQPERWELGAGAAAIAQGSALLAFDIINWLNSNNRAAAFRALHP